MQLKKVTLLYIDIEDRIRMSAEPESGDPVVFWLTQRMSGRLVGVLTKYLEKSEPEPGLIDRDVQLAFQQQDAGWRHVPSSPVRVEGTALSVLPAKIDVSYNPSGVVLSLPVDAGGVARLQMNRVELRQLLGVLHHQYRQAGWPTDSWPSWVTAPEPGRN